jgi:hypothetical protein
MMVGTNGRSDSGRRVWVNGRRACLTWALAAVISCIAMAAVASPHSTTWSNWSRANSSATYPSLRAAWTHGRHLNSHRAHAAIVGGAEAEITSSPWQVVVLGRSEGEIELCGGTILDMSRILTSAYCAFGPRGTLLAPSAFFVAAGTSNALELTPTADVSPVSSVRVHPYFQYSLGPGSPDDVAVFGLPASLDTSTSIQSVSLVPTGSSRPEETPVSISGFGERVPLLEGNGQLYSLKLGTVYTRECGGEADALFVCATTSTGSPCGSDIGGGLTSVEPTPTLLGVTDLVRCSNGSLSGFANVAAPEIRDFIEGVESPPQAPRGGHAVIEGVARAGEPLNCISGSWTNNPTFTYVFKNSADLGVLQAGSSPTYQLTSANIGQNILCEVQASNAGGTGIGRTPGLGPIEKEKEKPLPSGSSSSTASTVAPATQEVAGFQAVAPPLVPDAQLASTALEASLSGIVSVKVSCPAGESSCTGTVTLRTLNAVLASLASTAKSKRSIVTLATGSFTVAGGKVTTVKLHLSAKARALLARSHVLRARATIVAHDPAGTSHSTQTVVTLRAASARRRKA